MSQHSPTSAQPPRPPRPRLVFRIGVVGHRPHRLVNAQLPELMDLLTGIIRDATSELLAFSKEHASWFQHGKPCLRIISPMADGTDRHFVEASLLAAADFKETVTHEFCVPMPFARAEYEKDFGPGPNHYPGSKDQFDHLLGRMQALGKVVLFELDGQRGYDGEAYGAAGRTVLRQSDLLVVVWDGRREGKRGGTEQTLDEARLAGVPVLWIDANAPHSWQLLDESTKLPAGADAPRAMPNGSGSMEALRTQVRSALALPEPVEPASHKGKHHHGPSNRSQLDVFLKERRRHTNIALLWRMFRDFAGDWRVRLPRFGVRDFEEEVVGEWPRNEQGACQQVVNWLRPFYAWPDKLAVLYSDAYRSTFVFSYLFAAFAVALTLLPFAANLDEWGHWAPITCGFLELFTILTILLLVYLGKRRRWHERLVDYRLAAELVRHLRMAVPLGGGRPFPQLPAYHATYGHPSSTWMGWYVRNVERDFGLPAARVDREYVTAYMKDLSAVVDGQMGYHQANADRYHRIEHRLHISGMFFLGVTVAACVLHVTIDLMHWFEAPDDWPARWLVFFTGFLPALGAALAGINNQGEFRRLSKRCSSMHEQLESVHRDIVRFKERLETATADEQFSGEAGNLASRLAGLMVTESLDWRVVLLDRPLDAQ